MRTLLLFTHELRVHDRTALEEASDSPSCGRTRFARALDRGPRDGADAFDPAGAYLRRHVVGLADAPDHLVFEPWTDPAFLRRASYPAPITELTRARRSR